MRSSATPRPSRHRRSGFTIIELMVVLAILSLLAALIMPAVQHARESARRTQCLNNLRQFGLALHNYQGSHRVFPPGTLAGGWSWRTTLLPYLDQGPLYSLIRFDQNRDPASGCYSCLEELNRLNGEQPGWSTAPPILLCPSGPAFLPTDSQYRGVSGNEGWMGPLGDFCPGQPLNVKRNGMLYFCSSVRARDVTDGDSNTLFVGESGRPSAAFCPQTGIGEMHDWLGTAGGLRPGRFDDSTTSHFWSFHPNGACFLFADGHTRFLAYGMDEGLFWSLGSRAGNEVVADF